jgi:hypothetical protein
MAILAACGAIHALSQQPAPPSGMEDLLRPHRHTMAVPANAPHTPEVLFDASQLGSPLKLDHGWRVGITSNQEAAQPEFDDSTWAVRDAKESFEDVPDEDHPSDAPRRDPNAPRPPGHKRPYVWFRLHVKLATNHAPVFLLLELPPSLSGSSGAETLGLDVYANGKRVQPEGPHADIPERYQQISRIYPLGIDKSDTQVTLAIRTELTPVGYGAYTSFFARRKVHLGSREDLDRVLELWSFHSLAERLPRIVNSILLAVLAMFLLALYFTQKGHPEYLLLALYELLQAPIGLLDLANSTALIDHILYTTLVLQLLVISAYLYFEFLVAFLALPKRWYIRMLRYSAPILAGISPVLLFPGHGPLAIVAIVVVVLTCTLWVLAWLIFIFATLIQATIRRNFEAGLLLIPLLLSLVGWIEMMLMVSMSDLAGHPYRSPLTVQAGPVPIHFYSIADFAGILVIVLIIFVRFLRIQRDQERASSELAAARSVQELMIPQEKLQTPGFEVESVYSPANEVGGDFYHVQATPEGDLLVVIGDVAGKGLKAAMNVSMLMGALRRIPERSPARILEALNRVLSGSESFTTCQAAMFLSNGEVILANAGHLPPYLNTQEVAVAGGLPLGVIADVVYEESRLYLHQGDRLLLLSDGVVEARRPTGELFGFERVHNLSNLSAFYIAEAAKSFGQEDDITVLTVRRQ